MRLVFIIALVCWVGCLSGAAVAQTAAPADVVPDAASGTIPPAEPSAASPGPPDPAAPEAQAQDGDAAARPDVRTAQTEEEPADDEESADADAGSSDVTAAGTDRDCADFSSQQEAQDYFDENGGSATNNVDRLDDDGDGIACEALDSGSDGTSDSPAGGVDTGGGGTATPPAPDGPLVPVLGGASAGLLIGIGMIFALRRRSASV